MKDFEKVLLPRRVELGLTLEEVASGICSVSYLSMIEAGKRAPSKKIAAALQYRLGLAVTEQEALSVDFQRMLLALKVGDLEVVESSLGTLPSLPEREYLGAELLLKQGFAQKAFDEHSALMSNQRASSVLRLMAAVSACYLAERMGDIHLAIQIGENALVEFSDLAGTEDYFELKATLANAYTDVGNLNRAYRLVSEKVEFQTPWQRVMQIWAQVRTLENKNEITESAVLVAQALELLQSIDKPTVRAQMLQLQCLLKVKLGDADIDEVRKDLSRAEDALRGLNHRTGLANALETRAIAEARLGDLEKAIVSIRAALDLITTEEPVVRAQLLTTSADVYFAADDRQAAMSALIEARSLLSESKAHRSEARIWRMMADIYEELGDKESVIACLKASTDLLGLSSSALVVR